MATQGPKSFLQRARHKSCWRHDPKKRRDGRAFCKPARESKENQRNRNGSKRRQEIRQFVEQFRRRTELRQATWQCERIRERTMDSRRNIGDAVIDELLDNSS